MSRERKMILVAVIGMAAITLMSLAVILLPIGESPSSSTSGGVAHATTTTGPRTTATVWVDPKEQARQDFTPVSIVIPSMNLNTTIIGVGPNANGAMDTPVCKSASDPVCNQVYWWDAGVVPGETGNSVIAGHVNKPDASPASFGNLTTLKVGDTLQVTNKKGLTLTFKVMQVQVVTAYAKGGNDPVINQIFGPSDKPDLNLITCIGDWDGTTFDHRLVIHTELVGDSPFPK